MFPVSGGEEAMSAPSNRRFFYLLLLLLIKGWFYLPLLIKGWTERRGRLQETSRTETARGYKRLTSCVTTGARYKMRRKKGGCLRMAKKREASPKLACGWVYFRIDFFCDVIPITGGQGDSSRAHVWLRRPASVTPPSLLCPHGFAGIEYARLVCNTLPSIVVLV